MLLHVRSGIRRFWAFSYTFGGLGGTAFSYPEYSAPALFGQGY